ncbi:WecB/TagA/CpsF family glycosyltransferase [Conexibacter arvalis]|uniref:N-acetylglucosaminyldiphosphoundecaprenol N-acetyl-beta-D-mannosaminyltransferase n=1 Tax=Conexibacter arvalis TaxID=912552 RepID=A0A840IBM3_9ACTN|nr:WecB/TagA/CpsF family glycosyltransferase [Conexibacter arvalis]MBB4661504.1 N-acetylglucosaminyldiphosphoundecaprenol N-acetyl-beta-D-mannosaminyltransferase [Conexibacter arvalis]
MSTSSFEVISPHPARSAPAPAPAPAAELPTVEQVPVLDLPLALTDYERALDWIDAAVAADVREYVCVAAVHTVMESREDVGLREAVAGAAFTVPDGQPLAWALRALGHDINERVYGPELMERACQRAARTGQRHYLYGGRDQSALFKLTLRLRQRFPGLRIVGGWSPPFRELSEAELDAVAADINRARPDVVWVGIGVPKQEKWMAAMRDRLDAPVLIGVGAAFDFHAGLVPQAPPWMQRHGLEWLFRLKQEPRRLWKRYARHNPRFVFGFARQWVAQRRGRPDR